ncbi:hypothetical protein EKL30_14700 [Candidimonas sp. SYP-B2681]|uniref:hypothetical protein n=1 Tax=Candidimonas sp. SYP-B2681 TaxID=2497686 RepID=UPI000F85E356|nr:hypothetical protein [Candidimonas sp. SYP-B2681]RTZ40943.1 hypothetical protein EKL30_14700 [Candidimonas sp. SYP-B2681]
MENPFGDDTTSTGGTRNYLLLVSTSQDNLKAIQKVVSNLKATVDKNAIPLWIDSKGIGVFMTTDLVAIDIRSAAFEGVMGEFSNIKDVVVTEVGSDWYAGDQTQIKNWLTSHAGSPLPVPADSRLRTRKAVTKRR